MEDRQLKIYRGYSKSAGSEEGACLIFANNAKEAKKLAFGILSGWFEQQEWIDVVINWLKDKDFLYGEASQDLLKMNIPHCIESPKTCKICHLWGDELNHDGICNGCAEEKEGFMFSFIKNEIKMNLTDYATNLRGLVIAKGIYGD